MTGHGRLYKPLSISHTAEGNSDSDDRARAPHAAIQSDFQLGPMRGRTAEFVTSKIDRPSFREAAVISVHKLLDAPHLPARRDYSELLKISERSEVPCNGEVLDFTLDTFLKGIATRYDDTDTDCAIAMEPVDVFQVSVEERILVVPFNLQSNRSPREILDMVNFAGLREGRWIVDFLLNSETPLCPTGFVKSPPQALGALRLSPSAGYNLLDWDRYFRNYRIQPFRSLREILKQYRVCKIPKPKIKCAVF